MLNIILPKRFQLLKTFSLTILFFSFITRLVLYVLAFKHIDFSIIKLIKIAFVGFFFDIGNLLYLISLYAIYLLIIPSKFHGSILDKVLTKFAYGLFLFIYIFSFLAEIPFWQEYQRRYNFIAVDYLLYTYEVVQNIHESFPLPLLVGIIILILAISIRYASKRNAYKNTFNNSDSFKTKLIPTLIIVISLAFYHNFMTNNNAEIFTNINENELAKSGMYSFFAAYKSNELNYNEFYATLPKEKTYKLLSKNITAANDSLLSLNNIYRHTQNEGTELKPNVIFIGLESMSATFLERYGNTKNWTPAIDSLLKESISFTTMYATGTRTIRGLEAISLAIPPTPGRSVVKRNNNENLFTIGEVFKKKGYTRTFFNGVDGYFDNMTNYFGFNGFDVIDRKKKLRIQKEIPTQRIPIRDDQVTYENVWGACDGDMYNIILNKADEEHKKKSPFFYFLMTNSNHKPYSYPDGFINKELQGTREGAVKYADKTLKLFFEEAKTKPWFKNTVFVIMADHCAYSAGKTEINVKNHHIPAYIYNLKNQPVKEVDKLSSQIDIFPTLFGYLNWSYDTKLFGTDINKMQPKDERAFIGNHRKVGLLKKDKLLLLETNKKHKSYSWNKTKNEITLTKTDSLFLNETISYYQSAFELFKNGKLKANN